MNVFKTLKIPFEFVLECFLIIKKEIESVFFTKPSENWNLGTKGNIILLPGFAETWVFLKTIADNLNSLGYRIFLVNSLGRNAGPIETSITIVKDFIENNQLQDIILLSHSKGGIIAKILLDDPKYSKIIKQSICVAVPYGGSILGYLNIFSLNQLSPKSDIIKRINCSNGENLKVINIYPKLDNHVIPNKSLFLDGAKNIRIDIIGHTRILETKATIEAISENIWCKIENNNEYC